MSWEKLITVEQKTKEQPTPFYFVTENKKRDLYSRLFLNLG